MQQKRPDYFIYAVLSILIFFGYCYHMITSSDVPVATTANSQRLLASNASTATPQFYVGQALYSDGELFGRIVEVSQSHVFTNGAVEPGVLLTFREREGMENTDLCWLPWRSAANMVRPDAP